MKTESGISGGATNQEEGEPGLLHSRQSLTKHSNTLIHSVPSYPYERLRWLALPAAAWSASDEQSMCGLQHPGYFDVSRGGKARPVLVSSPSSKCWQANFTLFGRQQSCGCRDVGKALASGHLSCLLHSQIQPIMRLRCASWAPLPRLVERQRF